MVITFCLKITVRGIYLSDYIVIEFAFFVLFYKIW